MYDKFIVAIHSKNLVKITFLSKLDGLKTRTCIPFDYGPSRRNISPNPNRYHFYDLDSPDGSHNLSITPDQLRDLDIAPETFDPKKIVTWEPKWFIERDW